LQRKTAKKNNVIMDGRDIGSFVLPDADFKFYLTADAEVRARRRCLELKEKGQAADYEEILKSIKIRDENDTKRDFAPLVKAADAILIDSTNMNIEQVCGKMLSIITKNDEQKLSR
jgi:cytidylate kinase